MKSLQLVDGICESVLSVPVDGLVPGGLLSSPLQFLCARAFVLLALPSGLKQSLSPSSRSSSHFLRLIFG